jgi:hypothetical protein
MENSFPTEPSHPEQSDHRADGEPSAAADLSSTLQEISPEPPGHPSIESELGADGQPETAHAELETTSEQAESDPSVPVSPGTDGGLEHDANSEGNSPSLEFLAERSSTGRLTPTEESAAAKLLTESLLGGRNDVARAVAMTPLLPWIVSVQAATQAWPEMKPSFRAQFLAGLARTPGESAARIRLSLARGLHKVDQTAARKLILLTLKLLRNKQSGLLEGKGAAIFANVLIGRGKAWVLQIPLQELKPAEADLLVFAALHGAFHAPQAPVAQLSIIRWAAASERLNRLPEALEQLIVKNVGRWSAKWQSTLRKEVANLPDSLAEQLRGLSKKDRNKPADEDPSGEEDCASAPNSGSDDESRLPQQGIEANSAVRNAEDQPGSEDSDDEDRDEDEEDDENEDSDGESTRQSSRGKQRPVYVSKTVPNAPSQHSPGGHNHPGNPPRRGGHPAHFNLQETLRQIDGYVAGLRNELLSAQKQLRQREDDPRRGRRADRQTPVTAPGELSVEELFRLNQQLESRNAELKARIEELTTDSEERAASSGLTADTPPPDTGTQLRLLLGFKLKDDYEDFLALQQEARDLVVQQHYKTVLEHVFGVLASEGVPLPNAADSRGS